VSQAKPVMMLARWNNPPKLMSLGDCQASFRVSV
jgi:hypothetical protein